MHADRGFEPQNPFISCVRPPQRAYAPIGFESKNETTQPTDRYTEQLLGPNRKTHSPALRPSGHRAPRSRQHPIRPTRPAPLKSASAKSRRP